MFVYENVWEREKEKAFHSNDGTKDSWLQRDSNRWKNTEREEKGEKKEEGFSLLFSVAFCLLLLL